MLKLYLRDVQTGTKIEADFASESAIEITWSLEDATQKLADKLARELHKHPLEILMTSPPFEIVTKWVEKNGA